MTLTYNKTWEVMQGLEDSFNRIVALDNMITDLQEAYENNDDDAVAELIPALKAYVPVYIRQYEKASQRAWNNTVGEVRKIDNPYRLTENELDYDDIVKYEYNTLESSEDYYDSTYQQENTQE